MNEQKFHWKVGFFVCLGLVLIAALMLNFSKTLSLWKPTYTVNLKSSNVGGIKPQAAVLLAGVQVGTVVETDLGGDGKSVNIKLKIYERYKVHDDARFSIDALGFLGDKYVAITPTKFAGKVLSNGDVVTAEEPFDFQEAAKASLGLIQRVDLMTKRLNEAIARIDRIILNEQTLTNLAITVANFRAVSEKAMTTVTGIDDIFQTNSIGLQTSVSNLVLFSRQLNRIGEDLHLLVVTNQSEVSVAVKNLQSATFTAKDVMADVRAGKGLVGGLLTDEALKENLYSTLSNLSTLSSNLNKYGLLYKPKKPKNESDSRTSVYPGKRP